jgi:riboflavin synthase
MFTGIIEQKGQVLEYHAPDRLRISSAFEDLQAGESIAVNGVCLTLLSESTHDLYFDLSPETLKRTTLSQLRVGDGVNLERALSVNARFGGHYVSGHVDTTAQVASMQAMADCMEMNLSGFNDMELLYLITKGSISVEGVSLTINAVIRGRVSLMLIPHTLSHTTLSTAKVGQQVNIEFDYLKSIVAHQLQLMGTLNSEVAV